MSVPPFRMLGATLGFAAVLLVPACGDREESPDTSRSAEQPASSDAASLVDPCALVTREEAGEALGAAVEEPQRPSEANIPPRLATCRYTAPRGAGVAVLTVMVRGSSDAGEAKGGFDQAREAFEGAQAVDGIGDSAFWLGNQLNVLEGTHYLIIGGDVDLAQAKTLAQRALQRL